MQPIQRLSRLPLHSRILAYAFSFQFLLALLGYLIFYVASFLHVHSEGGATCLVVLLLAVAGFPSNLFLPILSTMLLPNWSRGDSILFLAPIANWLLIWVPTYFIDRWISKRKKYSFLDPPCA